MGGGGGRLTSHENSRLGEVPYLSNGQLRLPGMRLRIHVDAAKLKTSPMLNRKDMRENTTEKNKRSMEL